MVGASNRTVGALLDILQRTGVKGYTAFLESLELDYPQLYSRITGKEPNKTFSILIGLLTCLFTSLNVYLCLYLSACLPVYLPVSLFRHGRRIWSDSVLDVGAQSPAEGAAGRTETAAAGLLCRQGTGWHGNQVTKEELGGVSHLFDVGRYRSA